MYLASLSDPSPPAGEVSSVNFQGYPGFDGEARGYSTWGAGEVKISPKRWVQNRREHFERTKHAAAAALTLDLSTTFGPTFDL